MRHKSMGMGHNKIQEWNTSYGDKNPWEKDGFTLTLSFSERAGRSTDFPGRLTPFRDPSSPPF